MSSTEAKSGAGRVRRTLAQPGDELVARGAVNQNVLPRPFESLSRVVVAGGEDASRAGQVEKLRG